VTVPGGARSGRKGRGLARWLVVILVLLAGCTSAIGTGPGDEPDSDRIGWENGYAYDDEVSVTPADGYNESEREAVVARAMARLERIRGLEFNHTVPVEVVSREEYRRNRSGNSSETHVAWNDQVWEGLFAVGESTGTDESFDETLGAAVQGYYAPGREEIVIVSDSPTPTVDRRTLSHELVHALQHQHFGLGPSPDTQDGQLAHDGVIEGEANYLEGMYEQRCDGTWKCIPDPSSSGGGGSDDINEGLLLTIYQPYATGPALVDSVRDQGVLADLLGNDWGAVDRLHDTMPESTEQVIHPETYPDEKPVNVTVPDRSADTWERFDHDPVADTVGEASIYAMFVSNDVVDPENRYAYRSAPSAGWGGDSLVPYDSNETADNEGAYVWVTAWDSETDAEQFHAAYLDLLDAHDASNPRGNIFVVPDGDFADAFRVVRNGSRVRIVNAPTVEDLDGVHDAGD
jgi:hypothetical protein